MTHDPKLDDPRKALRDEMQGRIAVQMALAKMDGHVIDKKAARYSAMAEYTIHVGRCCDPFCEEAVRSSLFDAVSSAIKDDPMNVPREPIKGYVWMETPDTNT